MSLKATVCVHFLDLTNICQSAVCRNVFRPSDTAAAHAIQFEQKLLLHW